MNFLDEFRNPYTKTTGCRCDWCVGNFRAVMTGAGVPDWTMAEWNNSKSGRRGALLATDAVCEKKKKTMTYSPTGLKGLDAWLPDMAGVGAAIMKDQLAQANAKTGFTCTVCNERNEYAAANRPNGTYVCSYH